MKIMSINAGSSSLKFSLFEMNDNSLIASGYFERVGLANSFYTIKFNGEKISEEVDMPNHKVAVEILLDRLISIGNKRFKRNRGCRTQTCSWFY